MKPEVSSDAGQLLTIIRGLLRASNVQSKVAGSGERA
jgi:hypothetical protein